MTREVSDDCNSFAVDGRQVWLRIARRGPEFAFHASFDGRAWELIRHFAVAKAANPAVGFLAQSPTGHGCTTTFEEISFLPERLKTSEAAPRPGPEETSAQAKQKARETSERVGPALSRPTSGQAPSRQRC